MRSRNGLVALLAAGGITVSALFASVGGASPQAPARGVSGQFSLIMMVHTLASIPQFNVPATTPWSGVLGNGTSATYRSIPCTGNAPVNNISSDLPSYNTRVAGSRAPSSLRAHPFSFRLVKTKKSGWQMRGRIEFTVCKLDGGPTPNPDPIPDAQKPRFFVNFTAGVKRMTAESTQFRGSFSLAGGTQRYQGLKGSGTIAGYFFCFAAEGCAAKGSFQDAQMVMHGSYSDPTPQLSTR